MSLILEALKKLEREKDAPDRGFLVMAQVPWVGEGRRGKIVLALGAVAAVAALTLGVRWLVTGRAKSPPPAAAAVPPTTLPTTATVVGRPASAGLPAPPHSAAPAEVMAPLPRYLPPPSRQAFPAPPRAAEPKPAPSAAAAAPPALAPPGSAAASPERPGALRLEAVSEQDGVAVAVINGQLVREGDRIGEATVTRIGVQEVEVEVAGRRSTLRF